MRNYTIQPYSPGDEDDIIRLLQLVFKRWPPFDLKCTPLDHWNWRYKDNLTGQTTVTVAKDGNKLVGCIHWNPRRVKVGGGIFLGCCSLDMGVHPDYRQIGISNDLISTVDELRIRAGMEFSYFETSNPMHLRTIKRKVPLYVDVTHFVRIKDIRLHLKKIFYKNKLIINIGFRTLHFINRIKNLIKHFRQSKNTIRVSDIKTFDDRINKLWQAVSDTYEYITERNETYLDWRYGDSRRGGYTIKVAQDKKDVFGYIVLKINKVLEDYPVGYIVDILTMPNRLDVADALISAAVHFFDMNNVNIVHSRLVRGHPYGKNLEKAGFVDSREKKSIFFTPYEKLENEMTKIISNGPAGIYITYGDDAFI